ncbi:hypothetical protein Syun_012232 [Stephania yunnanensis]|uniref:Amidase domain-containing protein n=1 Tax=Stephania yunnanensis TaxID=152371 RepID=A0AAP0K1I5_9MAGN
MAFYNSNCFPLILSLVLIIITFFGFSSEVRGYAFSIGEATIHDIQTAFKQYKLTSRELVELYIGEIRRLNPVVHGVIEVNPDALWQANKAYAERKLEAVSSSSPLHGIPILLKDNIATKDRLNTTACSFALLGSVVPRDAGVVAKLRKRRAIILGKAGLSEWASFRSTSAPNAWSGRGGQGKNPYVLSRRSGGSSKVDRPFRGFKHGGGFFRNRDKWVHFISCKRKLVVGIKPTIGLTSRSGIVPISPRQDIVGAGLYVEPFRMRWSTWMPLLVLIGKTHAATREASKFIPYGGYKQFLKPYEVKGKRLGVVRNPFSSFPNDSTVIQAFESHLHTLRQSGAILVNNLEINEINTILNATQSGEALALVVEFKLALNAYLKDLIISPVSWRDCQEKFEKIMMENKLDALIDERLKKTGITEDQAVNHRRQE